MAAPQGIVTFAGVNAFLATDFTITHGIAPNVCRIMIPPQPQGLMEGGTLRFTYGGTAVTLPNCKVDSVDFVRDQDGFEVWVLNILARRWKWRFGGQVSGCYNVRVGDTGAIRKKTIREPRKLAELCLKAMGEKGYDVSRLPNETFPEFDWDVTLPAEALARLCEGLGCRVVYQSLSDKVAIWPEGEGKQLPTSGDALENSVTVNPPERPDELIFVGDRTMFQKDIELEAVARDNDGVYKPINELTIRPAIPPIDGHRWYTYDFNTAHVVAADIRERVKEDLYRKFRIKMPIDVPLLGKVDDRARFLPLDRQQLLKEKVDEEEEERLPAVLWGRFSLGKESTRNNVEAAPASNQDVKKKPELVYTRGWQLDVEHGLVIASDPIYETRELTRLMSGIAIAENRPFPPKLFLRTAFGLRHEETFQWIHHLRKRPGQGKKFGTQPQYVKRSDIGVTFVLDPATGVLKDNRKDFDKQADHYLDEAEKAFQTRTPASVTYTGIRPVELDGAIQQVTFSIDETGTRTRASRDLEELNPAATSYKERRLNQRVKEFLKAEGEAARVRDGKLARRPP